MMFAAWPLLGYAPEDIAAYLGLDASECFLLYMTPVFQEPPFEG